MIARGARTIVLAVAVGALGCGGPARPAAPAPAISAQAPADPADRLLAFVPPDASFVMIRDRQVGLSGQFGATAEAAGALRGLRAALDGAAGPRAAFAVALLDQLLAGSMTAQLGWTEGDSVLVVYGLGLSPVLRASLDGATLRATLERAATTSGFALTTATWQGRAYYRIELPSPAFSTWLVLRLDDHEVVAAITGDPDAVVPHVLAATPTGPHFDPTAIVAAAYPEHRADARFSVALYPARLAAAFGDVVARQPAWMQAFAPCAAAGVELLAATPAITGAWRPTADAMDVVVLVDVAAPTAARLARDQRAIPRWPSAGDGVRAGLGVGVRTLVDVSEPWFAAFDRTATACGSPAASVTALRRALTPAPVALIDAAVVQYEPRANAFAVALGAHDPQALWAALRTLLPLRPLPPAPAEQVTMPGAVFMGGADALGVAVGGADPAGTLTALMAAAPGPREVFGLELGPRFVAQMRQDAPADWADANFTSLAVHGAIRGGQLAISMRATLAAGAHPQRAR